MRRLPSSGAVGLKLISVLVDETTLVAGLVGGGGGGATVHDCNRADCR